MLARRTSSGLSRRHGLGKHPYQRAECAVTSVYARLVASQRGSPMFAELCVISLKRPGSATVSDPATIATSLAPLHVRDAPVAAVYIHHGGSILRLPQGEGDLLRRVPASVHDRSPLSRIPRN